MNPVTDLRQLQLLQRLTEQREQHALASLGAARTALEVTRQALDAQQAIIVALESDMRSLQDLRAGDQAPGAERLLQLADRHRWLSFDLEKEQYYLGVAQSDWRDARRTLLAARRQWLAQRGKQDALYRRADALLRSMHQRQVHLDDLAQDDRWSVSTASGTAHG